MLACQRGVLNSAQLRWGLRGGGHGNGLYWAERQESHQSWMPSPYDQSPPEDEGVHCECVDALVCEGPRWSKVVYQADGARAEHGTHMRMTHVGIARGRKRDGDMPNLPCAHSTGKGSTLGPLTKCWWVGAGPALRWDCLCCLNWIPQRFLMVLAHCGWKA